jgi:hypothetical protein
MEQEITRRSALAAAVLALALAGCQKVEEAPAPETPAPDINIYPSEPAPAPETTINPSEPAPAPQININPPPEPAPDEGTPPPAQ